MSNAFLQFSSYFRTYDSVQKERCRDILEVAKAAFSEGAVKHILLTGGCFNHQKEIELVSEIVKSIGQHIGKDRVPGTILPSPPKNLDEIKRYYDSGIKASDSAWKSGMRAISSHLPGKSQQYQIC
jgi:hypothetical protein